jgi:hypothetical protein
LVVFFCYVVDLFDQRVGLSKLPLHFVTVRALLKPVKYVVLGVAIHRGVFRVGSRIRRGQTFIVTIFRIRPGRVARLDGWNSWTGLQREFGEIEQQAGVANDVGH